MRGSTGLLGVAAIAVVVGIVFWALAGDDDQPAAGPAAAPTLADDALRPPPVLQDFDIGGDFALDAHDGSEFDLADHRGEVFLLFFGYTRCPDFCPATLSLLAQAYEQLADRADSVTTLFVSVDPEHDRPERLAEYLSYFGVHSIGLTGSVDQINEIVSSYAGVVEVASESDAGPILGHSTYTYLIDGRGRVRYTFRPDDSPQFIAAGVKQVLDEATR